MVLIERTRSASSSVGAGRRLGQAGRQLAAGDAPGGVVGLAHRTREAAAERDGHDGGRAGRCRRRRARTSAAARPQRRRRRGGWPRRRASPCPGRPADARRTRDRRGGRSPSSPACSRASDRSSAVTPVRQGPDEATARADVQRGHLVEVEGTGEDVEGGQRPVTAGGDRPGWPRRSTSSDAWRRSSFSVSARARAGQDQRAEPGEYEGGHRGGDDGEDEAAGHSARAGSRRPTRWRAGARRPASCGAGGRGRRRCARRRTSPGPTRRRGAGAGTGPCPGSRAR